MTRRIRWTALALALVSAPLLGRADWSPVVEPYLRIQAALAADTLEDTAGAARAIAAQADRIGAAPVVKAARAFEAAADIKAARTAFAALSEAIITAAGDALGDGVRIAYCPMADSPWLQEGDSIRNPYYGKQMLTCGEFKK